jgi:transcriptional regulator GlxA family with amidase domain
MPSAPSANTDSRHWHVSLVVIPEVMVSPLSGLYDVLNCFELLGSFDDAVPASTPFTVEFVSTRRGRVETASGLPVEVHRSLHEVTSTDIVIVPSLLVEHGKWVPGRHAEIVQWLEEMHRKGALLCSACSGVLLLAETGLLDGQEATIHWAYAPTFRKNFPAVRLCLHKVLVASGERAQFVMSGASGSWHDLVLYLVARLVGPTAAQAISKFLLLQWHQDGQAPYIVFQSSLDHGDAVVLEAQEWLARHFSVASPVEEVLKRSGLPERSFKRRFTQATGYSPIAYIQHLRVQEAKHRLERTEAAVDDISWKVGYEDPAFFRRLFKRLTGITPGAYRRKFKVPPVMTSTLPSDRAEAVSRS